MCSIEVQRRRSLGLSAWQRRWQKTNLLKILSRITRPPLVGGDSRPRSGRSSKRHRFHPELTGQENTFLSGAHHRRWASAKSSANVREIVGLRELEKFI